MPKSLPAVVQMAMLVVTATSVSVAVMAGPARLGAIVTTWELVVARGIRVKVDQTLSVLDLGRPDPAVPAAEEATKAMGTTVTAGVPRASAHWGATVAMAVPGVGNGRPAAFLVSLAVAMKMELLVVKGRQVVPAPMVIWAQVA
jgi:hypothetical protein